MIYQTDPNFRQQDDGVASLRLNRLAYYSPEFIEDPRMRIDFTATLSGDIVFDLPISISIQNSNGLPVARYTIDTLAKSSQEVREKISNELFRCRRQQSNVLSFARVLERLTTTNPEITWRTESTYPGIREPERELRPCVPSLDEFLRDPDCVNCSFYSVRKTPTSLERIEAKIDIAGAKVSFTISLPSDKAILKKANEQRLVIDCVSSRKVSVSEIQENVFRKLLWEVMEVFWSEGGMGAYQHLMQDKATCNARSTISRHFNVQHFFYSGHAKVGAYLSIAASPHIAQISITQHPSDSPHQHHLSSGGVQLIFTSDSTAKAAPFTSNKNSIRNKFERSLMPLIQSSGEWTLERALTELLMNAKSEIYARPSAKRLLGENIFKFLSSLPNTKVKTTWNPSITELIGFLEGVQSVELYLDTSKQKNRLVLFDMLRIDILRDKTVTLTCTNPLRVKIETHLEKVSDRALSALLRVFDNQVTRNSNSVGTTQLTRLLNGLAQKSPENWIISSGQSTLPAYDDDIGHHLLNQIALPIIAQYLKLRAIRDHVEYSQKSNLTLQCSAPGTLTIVLGEDYHPYQIKFILKDLGLKAVHVIPQTNTLTTLKNSRIYSYSLPRAASDTGIESFFKTSLKLFFALVTPKSKAHVFANSQLRSFLDREFQ